MYPPCRSQPGVASPLGRSRLEPRSHAVWRALPRCQRTFRVDGFGRLEAHGMSDILFVKTSSLGDVVHFMPALTEARRRRAGSSFTWLVEETFAPIVSLHPGVDNIIPVASRRWRTSLYAPATVAEIAACVRATRTALRRNRGQPGPHSLRRHCPDRARPQAWL